jgi:hypothetical protein
VWGEEMGRYEFKYGEALRLRGQGLCAMEVDSEKKHVWGMKRLLWLSTYAETRGHELRWESTIQRKDPCDNKQSA